MDRFHTIFPQKKEVIVEAAGGPGVVSTFYLSNNGGLYDKHLGPRDAGLAADHDWGGLITHENDDDLVACYGVLHGFTMVLPWFTTLQVEYLKNHI